MDLWDERGEDESAAKGIIPVVPASPGGDPVQGAVLLSGRADAHLKGILTTGESRESPGEHQKDDRSVRQFGE